MKAWKHNITIETNADFYIKLFVLEEDFQIFDLTGWEAKMQIRRDKEDSTILIECQSGDEIILGDELGTVEISLPASVTLELEYIPYAVWELVITKGDETHRAFEGEVEISQGVIE